MSDRVEANIRTTYTPAQAAKFLGIEVDRLEEMTRKGELRTFQAKPRGPHFYLAGELDVMKSFMTEGSRPKFQIEKLVSGKTERQMEAARNVVKNKAKLNSSHSTKKKYETHEEKLAARRERDRKRRKNGLPATQATPKYETEEEREQARKDSRQRRYLREKEKVQKDRQAAIDAASRKLNIQLAMQESYSAA